MKKRNLLWAYATMLFFFSSIITQVVAQQSVVYIDPASYTAPQVGLTFTINVVITNVTNLYAYEFMLWYNTTLLNGVEVELPQNHFLAPSESNKIFVAKREINATIGRIWVSATLLPPESPKSGSGILATITFQATTRGSSDLQLDSRPIDPDYPYPVKLSDRDANPIACTAIDGTVEVLPVFPSEEPLNWLYIIVILVVVIVGVVTATAIYRSKKQKRVHPRRTQRRQS